MASGQLKYPIRGNKFSFLVEYTAHLHSQQTKFQRIDIYDTACFGKILLLDGHVQLSTLDEHAYHEALVHIPLMAIENPKRALVVGGGDGGVLRELCRWEALTHIDMVEIDEGVIEACQEFLPELSAGAFEDPRVHLHIADAFDFVAKVDAPYDLIVMDITDTYEGEDGALSESLITEKFHNDTSRALGRNGFLVSQADNPVFCPYSLEAMRRALGPHFERTGSYQAVVPSYGGFSAFCWASKGAVIPNRPAQEFPKGLTYLNQTTYGLAMVLGAFGL